jgi:hypothetical protein
MATPYLRSSEAFLTLRAKVPNMLSGCTKTNSIDSRMSKKK